MDPEDPEAKVDPKTPDAKVDAPKIDDIPLPPTDPDATPPKKKAEPKKSGLPFDDNPAALPRPTLPKIDLTPPDDPKDPKDAKDPKEPKADPEKQSVFNYVPGDAISFAMVRVGDFMDSPSGAKVIEMMGPMYAMAEKQMKDELQIGPKDVRSVLVVGLTLPQDPKAADRAGFLVIDCNKPFSVPEKVESGSDKSEVAGKVAYEDKKAGQMLVILSPTRVMVGSPEIVTNALKGAKAGALSVSAKQAATSKALVYLSFQVTEEIAKLRDDKLTPVRDQVVGLDAVADATAGDLMISEDPSLKIALKLKYADADKAEKSKKTIEDLVEQGSAFLTIGKKEIEKLPQGAKLAALGKAALASVKPAVEGETLTVPLDLGVSIGDLAEIGMAMAPMFGPPGGPKGPPPPAPKSVEKE